MIEKNANWRGWGKINDGGLKKKHHQMSPIEPFLLDIIQILFRDLIQNTIADIILCKAPTGIFPPDIAQYFLQTLADNIILR